MSSTTTPHSPPVETSELVCSCVQSAACACLREAHYDGPHDHAIQTEVDDAHTVVPTHYAEPRRHTRRKCMSLSKGRPRAERGNDPYDYELKFPEDEPFKEMGPMARVWKTFLEEYAKFDSDRVEDWRDALDVLLVFAGLFSAVVTTFVAQTSQSLQLDYGEVAAHLMWEMIHLQRAMMDGAPSSSVARSNISPTSPVRVSRTNAWVNALWFTSLALSLTTALMAVLTKQWIHQYMAVPSGTPCDRSRIRQYRFENIDKWHVPLIIGILPVLMHFALGIFFFGLVIYVRALSTPTASVVGVIAFIAFMAYFGTTLLPVFKPDCPYKTYLTLYSYSLFAYMRVMYHRCFNLVRNWTHKRIRIRAQPVQDETPSLDFPMYIKEVEKRTVADMAGSLEVRALVGLYNISSNTSVQRIVLQAASILPLEFLSALKHGIPDVAQRIRLLVESMEYTAPDKQTAYERLYRAHVRFEDPIPKPSFVEPDVWTPSLAHAIRSPNALSLLVDGSRPEQAIAFLREQIMLKDSYQNFDVYVWARILQNALSDGVDWLDVGNNDSPVWTSFLTWIIQSHGCMEITACDPCCVELVSLPLFIEADDEGFGALDPTAFRLRVCKSPVYPSPFPLELRYVVTQVMRPSIIEYLYSVLFSTTCSGRYYEGLPHDILLNLALLQTPHVLATSLPTGVDEVDEDEEQPKYNDEGVIVPILHKTPVANLLYRIREYIGVITDIVCRTPGGTLRQHIGVIDAVFHTVNGLVNSETFLSGTLASSDRRKMVHALVRTFLLDPSREFLNQFSAEASPTVFHELPLVAFRDFPRLSGSIELVVEIMDLRCGADSSSPQSNCLWTEMFGQLAQRDWLKEFHGTFLAPALIEDMERRVSDLRKKHCIFYSCLAASYADGLESLSNLSPTAFKQTLDYLMEADNLFLLCKMLALCDNNQRLTLHTLSASNHWPRDLWTKCLSQLWEFLNSEYGRAWYETYSRAFNGKLVPAYGGAWEMLEYSSFEDLLMLLSHLVPDSNPIERTSFEAASGSQKSSTCDTCASVELTPSRAKHWLGLFRRANGITATRPFIRDDRYPGLKQKPSDGRPIDNIV